MSSVKTVTIKTERPWSNGFVRRRYEVTLIDNFLNEPVFVTRPMTVLPDDDGSAIGAQLLASKEAEEERKFEGIPVVLSEVLNPKWSSVKNIAKGLIRYMMREKDPEIVIQLEPLLNYIQTNFEANQIANLLDISPSQMLRMNLRINTILSDVGTAKDLLLAFNAVQEDIE